MAFTVKIDGTPHEVDVDGDTPLLWVLRDVLGMTGTKFGCGKALCGACTVHLDGAATRSCITRVDSIGESAITTIEAIGQTPPGAALQKAWLELEVVQCGYCQSGQIMSRSGRNRPATRARRCRARRGEVLGMEAVDCCPVRLEPDWDQLELFMDCLLHHRGPKAGSRLSPIIVKAQLPHDDFRHIVDYAVDVARRRQQSRAVRILSADRAVQRQKRLSGARTGFAARAGDLG